MTKLLEPEAEARPVARVAILQRIVPHYRVAFFDRLRTSLAAQGIRLDLYAGAPRPEEAFEDCRHLLPWATPVRNRYLPAGLYYQPGWTRLLSYDVVVMEHANAPLANHLLLVSRLAARRPARLFFWGHGDDFQNQGRAHLQRGIKACYARFADHWLAYTEASRERLLRLGLPSDRITVVNNAIDTSGAIRRDELSEDERRAIRAGVGLGDGPLAVFCSRLHEGKQIPFLIEACRLVHSRMPEFQLLILGDGPLMSWLRQVSAGEGWIRIVGTRYGAEKWRLLAASDLMLMPAHIGLSILDGFAAGLPVLSAHFDNHSPEVAYLKNGVNGFLTDRTPEAFARAVIEICSSLELMRRMSLAAAATAYSRSLPMMVSSFEAGLQRVLLSTPLPSESTA
ncbi:glycosyltransferase family 4 protein [Benzoatithermus flavus]|uniref:Glycosyltransferase family 4 protein n=1 Tax=Benzoatithermus flavus TaxID=3108223 RepID=A0ABU8XPC8_9PROT